MDVTIVPNKLQGRVTPPPSKSQTHRVILAAALARGRSRLENVAISQDILATLSCIGALGAHWERKGERTLFWAAHSPPLYRRRHLRPAPVPTRDCHWGPYSFYRTDRRYAVLGWQSEAVLYS